MRWLLLCTAEVTKILRPRLFRSTLAVLIVLLIISMVACTSRSGGRSSEIEIVYRDLPHKGRWPVVRHTGGYRVYEPQSGRATWYGPRFAGRRTSNGETFKPSQMTAAHRTLPFNTLVKVTRTDTGKSVTVRINDRGPFTKGRIIDLSQGAAKKIGMLRDGVAPCRVEVIEYPLIETGGPSGNG
jgi:rare lipoprotein A